MIDDGGSSHPDIPSNRVVPGYDFTCDGDNDPSPEGNDSHGMACAGIIAASQNNYIGVTGIAPNCKIMYLRIFSSVDSNATDANTAEAIDFAWENGADIINNSWGYRGYLSDSLDCVPDIKDAINRALTMGRGDNDTIAEPGIDKGCIVVNAIGNNANRNIPVYDFVHFPACIPGVLAVGATDKSNNIQYYSPRDNEIAVVAPSGNIGTELPPAVCGGVLHLRLEARGDIWTTDVVGPPGVNSGQYNICPPTNFTEYVWQAPGGDSSPPGNFNAHFGGTSAACPQAAGIAALILSVNPNLEGRPLNPQVQNIIKTAADDLGPSGVDTDYGYGRVNAYKALLLANGGDVTTNIHWDYDITLNGNMTVNNGKVMTIGSGVNVNLNGHYIKCLESGYIVNNGTVSSAIRVESGELITGYYSTIASAIENAGPLDCITLCPGTFSQNIIMPECITISGSGRYSTTLNGNVIFPNRNYSYLESIRVNGDILIQGGTDNWLHNILVDGDIDIQGGTSNDLTDVKIQGNNFFEFYNTNPSIENFYSANNGDCGMLNYNSSFGIFDCTIYNKSQGVIGTYNSDASIAVFEFCNNSYDLWAGYLCNFYVYDPIAMSSCPPPIYGNVTLYDPCFPCASLSQSINKDKANSQLFLDSGNSQEDSTFFKKYRDIYWGIKKDHQSDRENKTLNVGQKYAKEYGQVITGMEQIVENYPDTDDAKHAIKYIAFSHKALDHQVALDEYLNKILRNKDYLDIFPVINDQLLSRNIDKGEYKLALQIADEIIHANPESEQALAVLYRKGVVYDKYLRNYEMAAKMYQAVIELGPRSATAFAATRRLEKLKDPDKSPMSEKLTKAVPVKAFTVANYPNPFNPETHIKFDIPEADHVTIEIFDVNGRLVNTLADNQYEAGQHSVTWRGTNTAGTQAASGMYFYRVRYRDQVKTQKMLLIR